MGATVALGVTVFGRSENEYEWKRLLCVENTTACSKRGASSCDCRNRAGDEFDCQLSRCKSVNEDRKCSCDVVLCGGSSSWGHHQNDILIRT